MSPERRKLLEDLRRRQILAEAQLTPGERLRRAEGLRDFAARVKPQNVGSPKPVEVLVRLHLERLEKFGRG